FDHRDTFARVTAVNQLHGAASCDVQYEFTDETGQSRTGSEELHPGDVPPADWVEIVYSAREPSVSRISYHFSQVPLIFMIALASGCFCFALAFLGSLRTYRRAEAVSDVSVAIPPWRG